MHSKSLRVLVVIALLGAGMPATVAQQKLETPEQTNQRIRELASAFQARGGDYQIGSGDLLRIEVFDVPDLSREVRVSESGYISLPLLPVRVRAGGLTAFQLEEKLAELLQVNGLVRNPQVTVFVKEQRSQPITVIGAVRSPLVYQAIRQTTLLEVLSQAGGIADDAGSVVIVTRPAVTEDDASAQAQTFVIKLRDLLESGDPRYNIPLQGGDVVSVPRAGIVYVVGAVEQPGGFVLQSDSEEMTVLKAVALARGLLGTARPSDAVVLRKDPASGQKREIEVDLKKVMARQAEDIRLYPNDILFVPDSTGKKALRRLGEVGLAITSGLVILRAGR
ncbi:MAG: polysaccharide export protein [Firmicutes bacterium]|nr:polysaccharide export protein [Bacillota bacterium]